MRHITILVRYGISVWVLSLKKEQKFWLMSNYYGEDTTAYILSDKYRTQGNLPELVSILGYCWQELP